MQTYYEGCNGRLIPVRFICKITSGKIRLQPTSDKFGYSERDFIDTYPRFFVTKSMRGTQVMVIPAAYN